MDTLHVRNRDVAFIHRLWVCPNVIAASFNYSLKSLDTEHALSFGVFRFAVIMPVQMLSKPGLNGNVLFRTKITKRTELHIHPKTAFY